MKTLVDRIEQYIKQLLDMSPKGSIELKRNDLAAIFMCVPSQINYVLETRFTNQQGYYVETRRGAGGYIRVIRLSIEDDAELEKMLNLASNKKVSQQAGECLINRLTDEEFLTERENILLKAFLDTSNMPIEAETADLFRSHLLKTMLLCLLRENI